MTYTSSEHSIQSAILDLLHALGIFCWRNNTGAAKIESRYGARFMRFGLKGSSDILGIYRGRFLAIEVKAAKGRLSPEQKQFLETVKQHGGIAIVARSVDDVIAELRPPELLR